MTWIDTDLRLAIFSLCTGELLSAASVPLIMLASSKVAADQFVNLGRRFYCLTNAAYGFIYLVFRYCKSDPAKDCSLYLPIAFG